MNSWKELYRQLEAGNFRAVARAISLVENSVEGYQDFLETLHPSATKLVGVTGPPGAGKSTLVDALIGEWIAREQSVAVVCVDPSSPFNQGALLGDRIRMSSWYNHPGVFIRSLATRGSLGGLHPKIIEITDVLKAARFDAILVETVGVGQTEIEIAGLADTTVLVLVPEGGDDVQAMKSGLMEVGDLFAVNKADRPGADGLVKHLRQMLSPPFNTRQQAAPILKTVAAQKLGVPELFGHIIAHQQKPASPKKEGLLLEKAYQLIQHEKMKGIDKEGLQKKLAGQAGQPGFNLYRFVKEFL
ncbi:MAG: methylmalonyl Co-A mutase-associated GTPase MeaB [Williamsia sp.]|nr:methylmalonyl Co-A mutase-associated GTPase MeaB [Williamsia sp.]